jgi:hypothetical protein
MPQKKKKVKQKEKKSQIISEISDMVNNTEYEELSEREICTIIANKYKNNVDTIRTWWKRAKTKKDKIHGNCILTNVDEELLVGILIAFSHSHSPISKARFLKLVRDMFNLKSGWDANGWYLRFMERNREHISSKICTRNTIRKDLS